MSCPALKQISVREMQLCLTHHYVCADRAGRSQLTIKKSLRSKVRSRIFSRVLLRNGRTAMVQTLPTFRATRGRPYNIEIYLIYEILILDNSSRGKVSK